MPWLVLLSLSVSTLIVLDQIGALAMRSDAMRTGNQIALSINAMQSQNSDPEALDTLVRNLATLPNVFNIEVYHENSGALLVSTLDRTITAPFEAPTLARSEQLRRQRYNTRTFAQPGGNGYRLNYTQRVKLPGIDPSRAKGIVLVQLDLAYAANPLTQRLNVIGLALVLAMVMLMAWLGLRQRRILVKPLRQLLRSSYWQRHNLTKAPLCTDQDTYLVHAVEKQIRQITARAQRLAKANKALQQNNAQLAKQLRISAERSGILHWRVSLADRKLEITGEAALEGLGLKPQQTRSVMALQGLLPAEERKRVEEQIQQAIRRKTGFDLQARIRCGGHQHRQLRLCGQYQAAPDHPGYLVGCAWDLTEQLAQSQQQASVGQQLFQLQAQLTTLTEQRAYGLLLCDAKGTILSSNELAQAWLGDDRLRICGQNVFALLQRSSRPIQLGTQASHSRWLPLDSGPDGINGRIRFREHHHQGEAYFVGVIEPSASAAALKQQRLALNPDGTIAEISPALAELVGLNPNQLVGQSLQHRLARATPEQMTATLSRLKQTNQSEPPRVIPLVRADGARLQVLATLAPVPNSGQQLVLSVDARVLRQERPPLGRTG
ncbi:PAS domain-containing protein [Ferrimonas marina]|nr:PAS domain-containing protein [Ferrimonas marina]